MYKKRISFHEQMNQIMRSINLQSARKEKPVVPSRRVCIVYRRPTCMLDRVVQLLGRCGEFTHCELFFPELQRDGTRGFAFTNFMWNYMRCDGGMWQEYADPKSSHFYAMHEVWLQKREYDKLLLWCENQVANHTQYDYAGISRLLLPSFLNCGKDTESSAEESDLKTKLYCSEAIILALRHALDEDHPFQPTLRSMTACQSRPGDIELALRVLPKFKNQSDSMNAAKPVNEIAEFIFSASSLHDVVYAKTM